MTIDCGWQKKENDDVGQALNVVCFEDKCSDEIDDYRSPHNCRCDNAFFKPPLPTAQTEHARDLKFDIEGLLVNRFGATEAILD